MCGGGGGGGEMKETEGEREGVKERKVLHVTVTPSPLTQLMSIEEVFMEHLKVQLRPSL